MPNDATIITVRGEEYLSFTCSCGQRQQSRKSLARPNDDETRLEVKCAKDGQLWGVDNA